MSHGRGNRFSQDEKPKNLTLAIKHLIAYCRNYLTLIILALLAGFFAIVLQAFGPDNLKVLTDEIANGLSINGGKINTQLINEIAFFLICLYLIAAVLNFIDYYIMATITSKIAQEMRNEISQKINRLPLKYFDTTAHGDIISRITNDVDVIGQSLNQNLDTLVQSTTTFIGALIMMFYTDWMMALTAIFSSLFGFIFIRTMISRSQKYFDAQQKGLGDINGYIEEIYSGHTIVKVYNGTKQAQATFKTINDKLYDSSWKSQFLSGLMMPMMMFSGNFGYVMICVVGASLTYRGMISFGVIVAFMMYIRLFNQPLSQLAQSLQALQRAAAAGERVFEFLNEPELSDESHKIKKLQNIKGAVEFRHVHFGYEENQVVIKDFSANIKAGQKVAIVGPTGAGKTTIVNLLMRFYELDSGQILIDGIPIDQVSRENLRRQFCMVLQDTWLFEGTITENVSYGKPQVGFAEVKAACKAVGIHHFILTLPQGYDTVLNDQTSLSTGQKQLLTIARAMIFNATLLILDEATSSVDTRTEKIVQEAMDKLTKGRTSFVIAHRLSTIRNADLILVIDEGDIVESGTHLQLLKNNGFYTELYNSQFEQQT